MGEEREGGVSFVSWLLKPFRKRKVIYPFRPMVVAMSEKDPELYAVVRSMPLYSGILR